MKKVGYYIPTIVFTAFYGLIIIGGGFSIVSPIVYGWIALFIISGILLSKGKVWGGGFGALPGIHLILMGTRDTNQIINEMPLGIVVIAFYLICCGIVYYKKKKKTLL